MPAKLTGAKNYACLNLEFLPTTHPMKRLIDSVIGFVCVLFVAGCACDIGGEGSVRLNGSVQTPHTSSTGVGTSGYIRVENLNTTPAFAIEWRIAPSSTWRAQFTTSGPLTANTTYQIFFRKASTNTSNNPEASEDVTLTPAETETLKMKWQ